MRLTCDTEALYCAVDLLYLTLQEEDAEGRVDVSGSHDLGRCREIHRAPGGDLRRQPRRQIRLRRCVTREI